MSVIDKVAPMKNGQNGQNKTLRNGLMGRLPMKLKFLINYLKSLKHQNYTLTKMSLMRQDIK